MNLNTFVSFHALVMILNPLKATSHWYIFNSLLSVLLILELGELMKLEWHMASSSSSSVGCGDWKGSSFSLFRLHSDVATNVLLVYMMMIELLNHFTFAAGIHYESFTNAGKYDNDHKFYMERFKLFYEYCDGLNISGYHSLISVHNVKTTFYFTCHL